MIREFKGRYRRSLLGPAWAIIQPLGYMAMFGFVGHVLNISSEGIPYLIFTYSALVPWTFFSNAVSRCGPTFYFKAAIVRKIALPREAFPIAEVIGSLVDFAGGGAHFGRDDAVVPDARRMAVAVVSRCWCC